MPMGSNFGDIDNDGFLDIYLGTGSPSYGALKPSVLLRNRDGKTFVDVTASSGTGEMHKGHGVAFADLDNDGDEEIVFKVGGATPGDAHAFRLFENPGHGNDWLGVNLVGVKTNRAAIGARIKVTVENAPAGRRSIYRTVNSGGSFGASPLQQHIGLGKAARIVDLEVFWPVSNTRQHFANVAKNQVVEIRELDDRRHAARAEAGASWRLAMKFKMQNAKVQNAVCGFASCILHFALQAAAPLTRNTSSRAWCFAPTLPTARSSSRTRRSSA